jgi:hypothetical protein
MINFKSLLETVYEPKSGDEKNFKDKHVVVKYKTPYDTESQFTSDKPKAKRKADHDKGEDEAVYEAATVHTKRADKEAVIVRAVDPKTGESKAKVVQRRAGEIKIGEEVEQIDELSDDKLQSYHAKAGADRLKAKAEVEKGMKNLRPNAASVQKTADSYKRFVKRGKGMTLAANKMSEEVDLEESITKMSDARLKLHATKNLPHGSYSKKEIDAEHARRKKTGGAEYASVKPSMNEEAELDEKVKNPYAVGMAAAMKATGDTPPLKKSTIVKGHEIAKSIKKEAMDPVGKHDADIDNDGDTDKSDKYLINRRKAIGKALRKEDLDEAVEVSHDRYMRSHGKKASGGEGSWMFTHKRMGDANMNDPKEVHTAPRGKFSDAKKSAQEWAKKHGHSTVYVMEEVEHLEEAPGKRVSSAYRMTVPMKDGKVHPDHAEKINDLKAKVRADNAKEGTKNKVVLQGRLGKDNPNASKYKSKFTGKSFPGSHQRIKLGDASHADVYVREEVEMIDEAVKVGAMKLHDGSSVTITRAMADSLNNVLEQLNPMNRVKMEQKLHASKKDFDEILKFAENVNG